jgi:hypothetical protein
MQHSRKSCQCIHDLCVFRESNTIAAFNSTATSVVDSYLSFPEFVARLTIITVNAVRTTTPPVCSLSTCPVSVLLMCFCQYPYEHASRPAYWSIWVTMIREEANGVVCWNSLTLFRRTLAWMQKYGPPLVWLLRLRTSLSASGASLKDGLNITSCKQSLRTVITHENNFWALVVISTWHTAWIRLAGRTHHALPPYGWSTEPGQRKGWWVSSIWLVSFYDFSSRVNFWYAIVFASQFYIIIPMSFSALFTIISCCTYIPLVFLSSSISFSSLTCISYCSTRIHRYAFTCLFAFHGLYPRN